MGGAPTPSVSSRTRPAVALLIAVLLVLGLPSTPEAHEIPSDVTILAFVAPEGSTVTLLLRVPLEAMRDFDFPVTGPGYVDVAAADGMIRDAARLWIADYVRLYEDGRALPTPTVVSARISTPSDRSFESYDAALAHMDAPPLPASAGLPWEQALLDVRLETPVSSEDARFSVDSGLAHLGLRTVTVLRFVPADGPERVFQFTGSPGLVRLDPRWHQAALRFVILGFEHILDGIDHLLFLLCLVIPFRRIRPLIAIVTSFTVAHSITLGASALGLAPGALWFPALIETLIALSIVYMALENILGPKLERRWVIAFGFGLVHGFGFSFALSETLQFAGRHLLTSLFAFNLGVELGQIFVLLLAVPALELLFRRIPERSGVIVLSALIAHQAWHWMTDRGSDLLAYGFRWPVVDALFVAAVMRWLALGLVLVGVVLGLRRAYDRFVLVPRARAGAAPYP